ncbi:MAG: tRNA (adenosine(37)-N6)-dimethylallyltransferase MiaA [Bacteroidetes bacterium B1(2017)]|nr:MAG: tRNA (adenosine(37)-N6)-dimethylallyltransferase MiaA [Bacteroidetes bacterium B1(2017)]
MRKTVLVINGPTAIGKTQLSLDLALSLQTEIISTDSRQFYREMSIGTAKPSAEELALVPHHFINNRSVNDYYSAGDFEREALVKIDELFAQGKETVIAIGGSGLYIKALCEGLNEMPAANLALRNELIENFETHGITWLQGQMKALDAEKYATLDIQNPQRLMRAIELHKQGGITNQVKKLRPFTIVKIGLEMPREKLYERINKRVDIMMEQGLYEEAKSLFPLRQLNALQTVGYNELFAHFAGEHSLERAVELIKQHTRNYAKRQLTWFKADTEIKWFNAENQGDIRAWVHSLGA